MIMGINTSYTFENREYHIQCEDLGEDKGMFELRVYQSGNILWQKRVPYKGKVGGEIGSVERDEALRGMMARLVKTVQAAIQQGKLTDS